MRGLRWLSIASLSLAFAACEDPTLNEYEPHRGIITGTVLFQQAAPVGGRGRVMAIYQLGFVGGGPIGALLSGFGADILGLHATLWATSGAMLALVAGMWMFSSVSRLR